MMSRNKKIMWWVIGILVLVAAAGVLDQFLILQKAHSTFHNYYTFRGCTQLISTTTTSGVCKTASGEAITIVEINGRWFLQGDGPGVW
jgi:hypothetical protein